MEQDTAQLLIELFIDCIDKRRFIDKTVNGIKINTWGGVNNEEGFNLYNFYRPRNFFTEPAKCMERPDFLLFHNNGESSIIEIVNEQSQLKYLLNEKYSNIEDNFYKYLGDYRYILCSNEINIDAVPDTWGILKIDMIDKKKYPHIILIKPALMVKKNWYIESQILIKNLCISKDRLSKIHKISSI